MMKTVIFALFCLLVSTGVAMAQQTGQTNPEDIQSKVEALNADIAELKFLSEKIGSTDGKMDSEALIYRLDERSFLVLTDFEKLVEALVQLPDETPHKQELKETLTALSDGVGDAIFKRISEIKQRINKALTDLESLSGGTQVSMQAYIQSLEAIRVKYYEALVSHLDGRKALGLSTESLRERLDSKIYLYAETLAGRIEFTAAALRQVRPQVAKTPADGDLAASLKQLEYRHDVNVGRLEAMIPVFDRLELDSSEYKAVMIQQASNLSVNYFSFKAILSILENGWKNLKIEISDNAPDIFFRLLLFLAVLFVFRILARITRRAVRAASDRSSVEMSALLKNMLVSTSGGLVMALGLLMALSQIGISLAPMLAGLGVAGFIVGFALQDTLGNFAAGAMILIYRPFDENDFVEVTGASGLVRKMNLVSTTITTFDNQTLVIPNSKIWGDVIKNVTAQTERRVDLVFGIGYDDDIEQAEHILNEIVSSHEKVLEDPKPNIKLHTLGDSSVDFIVRPWVRTDDYWDVYWDITREVKLRFDREGISIPYPQRDVHLYSKPEI
jgi:small conductance mechanosensitive channel